LREWDNLTSVQNPVTGENVIDPDEIKTTLRNYFKEKSTGPTAQTPEIRSTNILPPPLDIDLGVWNGIMKNIFPQEMASAINKLPKNKACGLDGISNEIFQLLFASNSDIIGLLTVVMNIAVDKEIYSTTITNGVMKKED
jgi:hypothetical protein